MVAFILYPMIIPGSISVIGLDMIWDPETDSQSLSMSGFSSILQPSRPNKTKKIQAKQIESNQYNLILNSLFLLLSGYCTVFLMLCAKINLFGASVQTSNEDPLVYSVWVFYRFSDILIGRSRICFQNKISIKLCFNAGRTHPISIS